MTNNGNILNYIPDLLVHGFDLRAHIHAVLWVYLWWYFMLAFGNYRHI